MATDRNKVRCAVEVFLDAKRVTLFLDWDITTDTGKAKAIEYLTDLYLDLEEQIAKQFKDDVGEGYRRPVDGKEAVQANQEGVLERCMDGIPGGPGGWERNMLLDAHVLQGLGKFRVPADWKPRMASFVEGVTEAMDVDAERHWVNEPPEAWDRAAAMNRHPSSTAVLDMGEGLPKYRIPREPLINVEDTAAMRQPLTFGMGILGGGPRPHLVMDRAGVIETTGSVADETLRPLRKTSRTPSTFLPTPELRGPGRDAGL